jgi:hypothetical protein
MIGADEEISPPVELWAEIEGQAEVRQILHRSGLPNPSADIAEKLFDLGHGRDYAALGKLGSQPANIAQKQFCRISAGRWWGGRARRRFVGRSCWARPRRAISLPQRP